MKINETYGVAEFQNKNYIEVVESIISTLMYNSLVQKIIPEFSLDILFNEVVIDFSKVTSWLNNLTIYFNIDNFNECYGAIQSDAIAADQYCIFKKYVDIVERNINGHKIQYINNATIFMFINPSFLANEILFRKKYLPILFHEIGHFYTNKNLKAYHLINKDLIKHYYSKMNIKIQDFEIEDFKKTNNIKLVYDMIRFMMYYTNLSETHAFLESINYEISNNLKNKEYILYKLQQNKLSKTYENILYISSGEWRNYKWMMDCLDAIKDKNNIFKQKFDMAYSKQLQKIYGNISTLDAIIKKYIKIFEHIKVQTHKLFNYYYNLYDFNNIMINHTILEGRTEFFRTYKRGKDIFPIYLDNFNNL